MVGASLKDEERPMIKYAVLALSVVLVACSRPEEAPDQHVTEAWSQNDPFDVPIDNPDLQRQVDLLKEREAPFDHAEIEYLFAGQRFIHTHWPGAERLDSVTNGKRKFFLASFNNLVWHGSSSSGPETYWIESLESADAKRELYYRMNSELIAADVYVDQRPLSAMAPYYYHEAHHPFIRNVEKPEPSTPIVQVTRHGKNIHLSVTTTRWYGADPRIKKVLTILESETDANGVGWFNRLDFDHKGQETIVKGAIVRVTKLVRPPASFVPPKGALYSEGGRWPAGKWLEGPIYHKLAGYDLDGQAGGTSRLVSGILSSPDGADEAAHLFCDVTAFPQDFTFKETSSYTDIKTLQGRLAAMGKKVVLRHGLDLAKLQDHAILRLKSGKYVVFMDQANDAARILLPPLSSIRVPMEALKDAWTGDLLLPDR
jgi:hypothetical protein